MNTGVERPVMRGNTNKKVKTRLKPANRCEKQHSVNFNILLKIVISLNPLHDYDINPWFDCPVFQHHSTLAAQLYLKQCLACFAGVRFI